MISSGLSIWSGGVSDAINQLALYDFNFATGQIKGAQWSDAVVTRASTAYALNGAGAYESFASNVLRRTNLGVTIEEARTNIFSNSAAPATQAITVVNGTTYTVSCFVSGSVVLSGAGTGTVTPGSNVTFTASSTSLTCTVSGSPFCVNVEAASFGSSPIVGSGATTTRPADVVYWPVSGVGTSYSLYGEIADIGATDPRSFAEMYVTVNDRMRTTFLNTSTTTAGTAGGVAQTAVTVSGFTNTTGRKSALRVATNNALHAVNGTLSSVVNPFTQPLEANRVYIGSAGGGSFQFANQPIRRTAILPALTDAQLQRITAWP